jgi:hypothetical protein
MDRMNTNGTTNVLGFHPVHPVHPVQERLRVLRASA